MNLQQIDPVSDLYGSLEDKLEKKKKTNKMQMFLFKTLLENSQILVCNQKISEIKYG